MWQHPTSGASSAPVLDREHEYDLAAGLVDVLTDLFDANQADLPHALRLAHVWIRRYASGPDGLGHCDGTLVEALADIAAEARRSPERSMGLRIDSSIGREL